MKIAIIHYHLNRGGVTRVIANQLQSLNRVLTADDNVEVAILFGGRAEGWPQDLFEQLPSIQLHQCSISSLDYDEQSAPAPDALATALKSELNRLGFLPEETVLHVHNHGLGKNVSLPGALQRLAESGFSLLLQIHDFAEDYRSANYLRMKEAIPSNEFPAVLYPTAAHVHYAVLNRRDQNVLLTAGLSQGQLHFLPNPVPLLEGLPKKADARTQLQQKFSIDEKQQYLLYPVRAIRRKNMGEAILLALLQNNAVLGITLRPINPVEKQYYNFWKQQLQQHPYPVRLETGEEGGLTFFENLSAADRVITTSVAEGFGMVYLESWLADRQLSGRNLPEITADFVDSGLQYSGMYDRLAIPSSWIDPAIYELKLRNAIETVRKNYSLPTIPPTELQKLLDAKIQGGTVDFAELDEQLQSDVINLVQSDMLKREELLSLNPALILPVAETNLISENKALVEQNYSLVASGTKLRNMYQQVVSSPRATEVNTLAQPELILDQLLNLSRLKLIRT